VLALVLLLAVVASCVSLGRWQLRRAAQREAITAAIAVGQSMPPVVLNDVVDSAPGYPDWQEWQTAQATGIWLNDYAVLLDNRNFQGRPGLWLATPLRLTGASDATLLVLRGWLPRPGTFPVDAGVTLSALPDGVKQVQGQLRLRVPRLYELWQRSGRDTSALPDVWPPSHVPVVQNLDLLHYAQATGLKLLPVVLEQTDAATDDGLDGLIRQWATPSLDADKNRGYALQWFGFAAIAGVALLVLLGRTVLWRFWQAPDPGAD